LQRNTPGGFEFATGSGRFLTHFMATQQRLVHFGGMDTEHEPADPDYFYHRAEEELEQAQNAAHPAAVKAHYTLAGFYLDRVYGPGEAELGESPANVRIGT
jgi:hypothetical protein